MRITLVFLSLFTVGLAPLLGGCSSLRVANDYDPSADFGRYDSFDWLDNRPGVTADASSAGSLDASLRREVGSRLAATGIFLDGSNPELLVIYHVGEDDEIDAGRWGYRYDDVGKGWGGDVDVRAYRAGTLVVDLIDAASMRLIWRASADGVFREKDAPKNTEERMNEAVDRMLEVFPPAR